MNLFNHNKIQDLIDHGYNFDIGDYFSDGFEIVKKEAGLFIAFTLVYFVISFVASFIPFSSLLISPPLIAGYLIAAHKVDQNERLEFGDFFKGFDYFGQLIVQQLILVLIIIVLMIPIFIFLGGSIFMMGSGGGAGIGIVGFLLIAAAFIGAMYIAISYIFASMYIIFGDMQAWDAMEASRKVVAQNFFPVLGLVLLTILLNMGGALLCGVGLLFTIPATYAIIYVAFKDIMDFDVEGDENGGDILDHLVD